MIRFTAWLTSMCVVGLALWCAVVYLFVAAHRMVGS